MEETNDMEYDQSSTMASWIVRAGATAALNDLCRTMLDYCVPPVFLGTGMQIAVDDAYSRLIEKLRYRIGVEDMHQITQLEPDRFDPTDPIEWLIDRMTSYQYFRITSNMTNPASRSGPPFTRYPELIHDIDTDGLLKLDRYRAQPNAILHNGSALHYHPFLRRGFSSAINEPLIQTLLASRDADAANQLRIAVDPRGFMPASALLNYREADYWYGPKLMSAPALDDFDFVGTTVHTDPHADPSDTECFDHCYESLIVNWESQRHQNLRTCQIEEVPVANCATATDGRILARYLHAIRDPYTRAFRHCDGAVKLFSPDDFSRRKQKLQVGVTRSATYRKVFRIDGAIRDGQWADIVAHWFRGNTLVGEYLNEL